MVDPHTHIQLLAPTGYVELEDPVNGYELHKETFAQRSVSHRKTEVSNEWVPGSFVVRGVKENVIETVSVWVSASTPYLLAQRVQILTDAFDQLSFSMTVTTNDSTELWICSLSDYTIETSQEFSYACTALVKATVPRLPSVTRIQLNQTVEHYDFTSATVPPWTDWRAYNVAGTARTAGELYRYQDGTDWVVGMNAILGDSIRHTVPGLFIVGQRYLVTAVVRGIQTIRNPFLAVNLTNATLGTALAINTVAGAGAMHTVSLEFVATATSHEIAVGTWNNSTLNANNLEIADMWVTRVWT